MEEWWDQVYRYATGWLGWSDEQAMVTPIPRILLALDGKIDFVRKTNPFGAKDESPGDGFAPPTVADKFRDFAAAHNAVWRRRGQ